MTGTETSGGARSVLCIAQLFAGAGRWHVSLYPSPQHPMFTCMGIVLQGWPANVSSVSVSTIVKLSLPVQKFRLLEAPYH